MRDLLCQTLEINARRTAVIEASSGAETTYGELAELAAGLDLALSTHDAHVLVIALPKSALFYAAVVRCLVRQLPFCCVDEDIPPLRIREICQLLRSTVLLRATTDTTQSSEVVAISAGDVFPSKIPMMGETNDPMAPYYIATSGSTGTPKLIAGRQASLANFALWSMPFYSVNTSTRWAQFSSTGFDLTLVDIVTVLPAGGALVALHSKFDRLVPASAIKRFGITHWHSVPSAIPHLLALPKTHDQTQPVLVFTFCGEPLFPQPTASLMTAYPGARVVNTYGPTEGTLFFMAHDVGPQDLQYETIPIGAPIPGWKVILYPSSSYDEMECIICSDLIAFGYVGAEDGKFGSVQIDDQTTRIFRTGDLLCVKDKRLFFVRRNDRMVKISGLRVDLGEIEALARSAGVANPVAFKDGRHLHLAYEITANNPAQSELVRAFGARLPPQLVPTLFSEVDVLPRSLNGKISHQEIRRQLARYRDEEV